MKKEDIRSRVLSYEEMWKNLHIILAPEKSLYVAAIVYGIGASIFSLAVPISVQSLVNSVAFTGLLQPLLVLSFVLFSLLVFSGLLNVVQFYVTELFQRHFFARSASEATLALLDANSHVIDERDGLSLVNKYFDIMTVQKKVTSLIVGGVAIALQTFAGLLLLGFYNPYFLIFDVLLLALLALVWGLFGKNGLKSATKESTSKYEVAEWLEQIAKSHSFFKTTKRRRKALVEADEKIKGYLDNRRHHFKFLLSQVIFLFGIYALMSSAVLGLGGYLVILEQLSLGQLVAAELVATMILGSLAKSGKHLEDFYDLYAAVEKLTVFKKLPVESVAGVDLGDKACGMSFRRVEGRKWGAEYSFNFDLECGKKYFASKESFFLQALFVELSRKNIVPYKGRIYLGDIPTDDMGQEEINDYIGVLDRIRIIQGSIWDNIAFGLDTSSLAEMKNVLDLVELGFLEEELPKGLDTHLTESGSPLWSSQLILLELAKHLMKKPKVLVLTDIFDQVEIRLRNRIISRLLELPLTLLVFSDKHKVPKGFDKYFWFGHEKVESYKDVEEFKSCLINKERTS